MFPPKSAFSGNVMMDRNLGDQKTQERLAMFPYQRFGCSHVARDAATFSVGG